MVTYGQSESGFVLLAEPFGCHEYRFDRKRLVMKFSTLKITLKIVERKIGVCSVAGKLWKKLRKIANNGDMFRKLFL
jgi:hypothetical protein